MKTRKPVIKALAVKPINWPMVAQLMDPFEPLAVSNAAAAEALKAALRDQRFGGLIVVKDKQFAVVKGAWR